MFYDPEAKVLVGGSTPEGDCGSYIPEVIESYFPLSIGYAYGDKENPSGEGYVPCRVWVF